MGTVLVSCGNKGDLYLIPDPISQQDMQQLQRVLDSNGIPATDAVDVDDQSVYVKPQKESTNTSGWPPVDK
jgi:predicted small lipoprotein YifL